MATLRHENILSLVSIIQQDNNVGLPWLVLEYMAKGSLFDVLDALQCTTESESDSDTETAADLGQILGLPNDSDSESKLVYFFFVFHICITITINTSQIVKC
jgi:serine/threonine protein kinase